MAWSQIIAADSRGHYRRTVLGFEKPKIIYFLLLQIGCIFSDSYHKDESVCNQFISHLPMESDLLGFYIEIYHWFMSYSTPIIESTFIH